MRTTKAEELLDIGDGMLAVGMQVAKCHVPSLVKIVETETGDKATVVVPIVGTGDRKRYEGVPFGITVVSDTNKKQSRVSLTPLEPDHLVGLHVYDPDHKPTRTVENEVESRAGFAALHALVQVGSREDWSDVDLYGEDPDTGALQALPFEQGTENAMTYMGILRAVAKNKLQEHMAATSPQQEQSFLN